MTEELEKLVEAARSEVAADEMGGLSFGTRKALLRAFGAVRLEPKRRFAVLGPGLIRRARLCVSVVQPLTPFWDEFYQNKAPRLMLRLAEKYLDGQCTMEEVKKEASAFRGGLDNSDGPETQRAYITGRAAVCAAYVAVNDEFLEVDDYTTEDDLLDPQDSDLWDCAYWASAAAAGGMPWEQGFSKMKYKAFWEHYLNVDVPVAWASVRE